LGGPHDKRLLATIPPSILARALVRFFFTVQLAS
jgi:hypothetical protein